LLLTRSQMKEYLDDLKILKTQLFYAKKVIRDPAKLLL
jgi:hypothetical protein